MSNFRVFSTPAFAALAGALQPTTAAPQSTANLLGSARVCTGDIGTMRRVDLMARYKF